MSTDISGLRAAFDIVGEPAAVADMGRIAYMNPPAVKLAGRDFSGEPAASLLPPHVLNCQAADFVTGAVICGVGCALRANSICGVTVYVFTPEEGVSAPGLFAAVPALRSELLDLKLASDRIVSMAASSGDERFGQYSAILSHSYYQLKRLVQNISVIDGLSGDTLPFSPQALDVSALCSDLVSAVSPFASRSGIELVFQGSGRADAPADSELIELMVLNLLSNSLMHTPSGGWVKLSVSDYAGGVMIAVDDSGSGIDPEIMKDIFSRWHRTLSLTEMSDGPGLGLAIARGIAEKHGGALIIESRPGSGASVRASLSRELYSDRLFRAPEKAYSAKGMDLILTQLSQWLPPEGYAYKYDD
jgi:hypothetical protein